MTSEPTITVDPRLAEVISTVKEINRAWFSARWDDLATLLDPGVIFSSPDSLGRAEGRDACIASYQEFLTQATIGWFQDHEWQVDLNGNVAVASYRFEISYEMGGTMLSEGGRDIWVLRLDEVGWTGIWRTITQGEGD